MISQASSLASVQNLSHSSASLQSGEVISQQPVAVGTPKPKFVDKSYDLRSTALTRLSREQFCNQVSCEATKSPKSPGRLTQCNHIVSMEGDQALDIPKGSEITRKQLEKEVRDFMAELAGHVLPTPLGQKELTHIESCNFASTLCHIPTKIWRMGCCLPTGGVDYVRVRLTDKVVEAVETSRMGKVDESVEKGSELVEGDLTQEDERGILLGLTPEFQQQFERELEKNKDKAAQADWSSHCGKGTNYGDALQFVRGIRYPLISLGKAEVMIRETDKSAQLGMPRFHEIYPVPMIKFTNEKGDILQKQQNFDFTVNGKDYPEYQPTGGFNVKMDQSGVKHSWCSICMGCAADSDCECTWPCFTSCLSEIGEGCLELSCSDFGVFCCCRNNVEELREIGMAQLSASEKGVTGKKSEFSGRPRGAAAEDTNFQEVL